MGIFMKFLQLGMFNLARLKIEIALDVYLLRIRNCFNFMYRAYGSFDI